MKTSLDVLSSLYQLLNVASITSAISGKVYIGDPPDGSEKQDIGLNVLNNASGYLQRGFVNVNIYIKSSGKGRPNLTEFQPIVRALTDLLEDAKSGEYFYQLDDDKGLFKDQNRDGTYFYNLKLQFQTFKN